MTSGRKNRAQGRTAKFLLGMFLASLLAAMPISMAGPSGSGSGSGFFDYSGACYDILTDTDLYQNVSFTSGSCILKGNLTIKTGFTLSLKDTTITLVEPAANINSLLWVNGSLVLDKATLTKPALPFWTLYIHNGGDMNITGSLLEGANWVYILNGTTDTIVRDSTFRAFRAQPWEHSYFLRMYNCIGVRIINNTFDNASFFIDLVDGKSNTFINNIFRNQTPVTSSYGAVNLHAESDTFFENMTLENSSSTCMALEEVSSATLRNSTFTRCNAADILVKDSSKLYLLNTYYDIIDIEPGFSWSKKSRVYLLVSVDVGAIWESDGSPVQNATLMIYNASGELVHDRLMGHQGHVDYIELLLTDYNKTSYFNYTPHRFAARSWWVDRDITSWVDQDISNNKSVLVTIDNILPLLNMTAPANGTLTNRTHILVNGTTDGPSASKPVANNVGMRSGNFSANATVMTNGYFEYDVPLQNEGNNTIDITVEDQAGNQVTAKRTVVRDTILPIIELDAPPPPSVTRSNELPLSGRTEPGSNLTYIISVAGVKDRTLSVPIASSGTFSTTIMLSEGANNITFKARDLAGNTNSSGFNVTLDTVAPVIIVLEPSKLQFVTNIPTLRISGNSYPGVTHLYVNDVEVLMQDIKFETDVKLDDGPNVIVIEAVDAANNKAHTELNVTLDTLPPVLTLLEPRDGQLLALKNVTLTGLTEPGAELYVNGTKKDVLANGSFSIDMALVEGLNMIRFTAKDLAGNPSYLNITLYRDTIAPALSVTSPKDGSISNKTSIMVDGTSEPGAFVFVNDENATMENGKFSCLTDLKEGQNAIHVIARDLAGNGAEISLKITVDTFINLTLRGVPKTVKKPLVEISGKTDPEATVTINDIPIRVEADGTFALGISLTEGDNQYVVRATDPYGNTMQLSGNVVYYTSKDKAAIDMGTMVVLPMVSILLIVIGLTLLLRLRSKDKGKEEGKEKGKGKGKDGEEDEGVENTDGNGDRKKE